jgi:hypothetical protein
MRTRVPAAAALVAASLFAAEARAGALNDRLALEVGIGTTGAALEGAYKVSSAFVVRVEGDFLEFRDGFSSDDVRYTGRAHLNTAGAFLDWHPMGGGWLLSAGAVAGRRKVNVLANGVAGSIKIDGVAYSLTQIGSVNGAIDFGSAAPFVGLGWDNTFVTSGPIGFRAVAGVIVGPSPTASLSATGPFAANPTVVSELAAEQTSLEHDARDLQFYPVVQLGLSYRF